MAFIFCVETGLFFNQLIALLGIFLSRRDINPMISPIAKHTNNKSALGKLRSQNQNLTTTISVFWRTKMISNTVSKMMMTIFVLIVVLKSY